MPSFNLPMAHLGFWPMLWKTVIHLHNSVPEAQLWPIYPLPSQAEWVITAFVCCSGSVYAEWGIDVTVIEVLQIVSFGINSLVKIGNLGIVLNEDQLDEMGGVGGCTRVSTFLDQQMRTQCIWLFVIPQTQRGDARRKNDLRESNQFAACFKKVLKIILPLEFPSNLFNDVEEYDLKEL